MTIWMVVVSGQMELVCGEFKNDNIHGQGKKTSASGDVIQEGQWIDDDPIKTKCCCYAN
jgi:MORN repeat